MTLVLWILAFLSFVLVSLAEDEERLVSLKFAPFDFAMVPQYKLVFCRILKAGSSALNHLLPAIAPPPFPQHPSWTYY